MTNKISNERLYEVLRAPVFSEKSQRLGDASGVQVFKVATTATKQEIKQAVEKLFGVEVQKVNTLNQRGKAKRFGRTLGRRNDFKKAYVTLKPGQDVQIADTAEEVASTEAASE